MKLPLAFGRPVWLVVTVVALAGVAACSSGGSDSKAKTSNTASPVAQTAASPASGTAQAGANAFAPVVASSELVVGQNRFALGILDEQTNTPLPDAQVRFRFFTLKGDQGTLRSEADARFAAPARDAGIPAVINHRHPDGANHPHANVEADVGVYIARAQFDQAGKWGVQAVFRLPDGRSGTVQTTFDVLAQPVTPAVGSPAPRTRNLTARDVPDLSAIDSAAEPVAALHQETVADAIAAGRPALVAFVTPGYCESRFCGPAYELVKQLLPKYGGKAALIQIEPFKQPGSHDLSDAAVEWRLQSEPYIFVVDRAGNIAAKFDGPVGLAELDEALARVTS